MPVFSLRAHATYRCGHSGACCRTPWDVPVEARAHQAVTAGMASGRLPPAADPFVTGPGLPPGMVAVLRRTAAGACTLLGDDRLCAVHRVLGEDALPSACRIFPRLALTDARGTFITLSHYCPTAARALLRAEVPIEIVAGPSAFPPGDYEGLDAREAWPPTLRPGVLMGLDGYAAWEHHAVAVLAASGAAVAAVTCLSQDVALLEAWQPGGVPLVEAIAARTAAQAAALEDGEDAAAPGAGLDSARGTVAAVRPTPSVRSGARPCPAPPEQGWCEARYAAVLAAVPADLRDRLAAAPDEAPADALAGASWPRLREGWTAVDRAARVYLAAHAFANWAAYQGDGLRVWMASVEAALAVLAVAAARRCGQAGRALDEALFVEAVREADLLLRHLASREDLIRTWS